MKYLVVGNCQARPLTNILKSMRPDWDALGPVIVHLAKAEDVVQVESIYHQADLIISQLVADTYPVSSVHTNYLKSQYPGKCLVWPNLYWRNFNPEIQYIRTNAGQVISGPLGDYHNEIIFKSWRDGIAIDACVKRMASTEFNSNLYAEIPGKSLAELRAREQLTEICISDFLDERRSQRTFWVMNHPANIVLQETAFLILKRVYSDEKTKLFFHDIPEFLAVYSPAVNAMHSSVFRESRVHVGKRVLFTETGIPLIDLKHGEIYSDKDLAECFYRLYDNWGDGYDFRLPVC